MSGTPRIFLAGASGLVGGELLRALLDDRQWPGQVLAAVRKPLLRQDPRLLVQVGGLNEEATGGGFVASLRESLAGAPLDTYVSCLGTTIRTAGSREAFIAVDRELVLRLAGIARELGARQAVLVSSVGASRQSGNFYLRVKGEVEDALQDLGFDRVDVLRPGLLLGARQEQRPGEAWAQRLSPLYNPLLLGRLRRYRSIDASTVAKAIKGLLAEPAPGVHVHEHDSLRAFAQSA